MTKRNLTLSIANIPQINYYTYLIKWLVLALIIGACIGSITAFFLTSLEWATNWRESHLWIIALLPIGELGIGNEEYRK